MRTLSLWASKVGLLVVPGMEFELGASCFGSSWCRRRLDGVKPICNSGKSNMAIVSGDSRCNKLFKIDWRCESLHMYPRFKILSVGEPKRCTLGASFELDGPSEQQEIGDGVTGKDICSVNGFGYDNFEHQGLGRGKDSDGGDREGIHNLNIDNEGEIGEEKNSRIDVRALAYSLRSAKTADDVEDVLKEKGELPLQVYCAMIRGFGKDKRFECAMAVVEWLKRKKNETGGVIGPNLFIYNSLLGAVKQSEQIGEMENILSDMHREGILPNVVTYNTLMVIYLEQGEYSKALGIPDEIRAKGFDPSPVSYSTALLVYRRMEDGMGALKFYVELRDKYSKGEIRKNTDEDWESEFVKLENFIIRICCQVMRRWLVKDENLSTNVLKLLTKMDMAGLRLGREEHERLIWACTREEHYVVGKELYKRIRKRYSDITLSVCNHLIWLMGKAKKWWAALEIYEDLLDNGPEPNNMSYELIMSHFNVLLTAASKRGIWRWGVRLLNKMEDKGLKPESRQWNAVLIACSKASETSAAIQIFQRMVENGERPTIISYGALLSALEKGQLYDEALRVWDHMLKIGVEPNVYAYTIMASVLTGQKKFNLVHTILKEMASKGIEPTVVTYNAILSASARNGMGSVAFEWFHRMKVQSVSPNEITYEMLIEALASDGKPRLAYELYLRAQNEGFSLSSNAYDAVVISAQDFGATIDLNVLGLRPQEKKK